MSQRLICSVKVECPECQKPLLLTFGWPQATAPMPDDRVEPRLLMCVHCRNPFVWLLPAGMLHHSVYAANGAPPADAVAVPFLELPRGVSKEPWRRRSSAAAALPAMERLQHIIWTSWPVLYTIIYLRQC